MADGFLAVRCQGVVQGFEPGGGVGVRCRASAGGQNQTRPHTRRESLQLRLMRIRHPRCPDSRGNRIEFFCSDVLHEHGREIRVAGQASPIHGVELAQRRLARQLRLTIDPVDQLRRSRSIRLSGRPPALRRQNPLRPPEQSQTHSRPRRNTTRPIRPRHPRNHPIERRPELTGRGGRRRIHRLHRLIIRPRLIRLTLIQPRPQRRLSHLNPVHCIQQRKLPTTGRPNL